MIRKRKSSSTTEIKGKCRRMNKNDLSFEHKSGKNILNDTSKSRNKKIDVVCLSEKAETAQKSKKSKEKISSVNEKCRMSTFKRFLDNKFGNRAVEGETSSSLITSNAIYKKSKPFANDLKVKLRNHWQSDEYLAHAEKIDLLIAQNIIKLLDEGNTIPFMSRYRRNLIGPLNPDDLRKIKCTYDYIKKVKAKQESIIKEVTSNEDVSESLLNSIQSAQTLEELEFLAAPFKKDTKGTLSQRARALNLDEPSKLILEGVKMVSLENYVNSKCEGLETVEKVKLGIQHIIADIISKTSEVQFYLHRIIESGVAVIHSKERKKTDKERSSNKYEIYKKFSQLMTYIKPHQILAINRGEAEKELSVKIEISEKEWQSFKDFCLKKWLNSGCKYPLRESIINDSLDDAIKRLIGPFVTRRVKAKLNKEAEDEAIKVFGTNLRQLLLTPCVGEVIMGIDPGFHHGCKVAIISKQGEPLAWTKFILPGKSISEKQIKDSEMELKNLILKYECQIIALGNGKGCRETETFLTQLIERNLFRPLNVSYTIVSEQGVSIYSCSQEALKEFPNLDVMFIGAVSLARRLQNPISELVKVEPKHLGIGLYQHDMENKRLTAELEEIVSECVSFVGVDINTASVYLLKRVAGLNLAKAKEIINYRNKHTNFETLEDLKKVKGIKEKTFLQCAGFFRIVSPSGSNGNPLDQTCIHPESYQTANLFAKKLGVAITKIGSQDFITHVKHNISHIEVDKVASEFGISEPEIQLIIDAFMQPLNHDIRKISSGPIFRKGVKSLDELKVGQQVDGIVRNVVPFGAFVDIGVGIDGLIHTSKMNKAVLMLNYKVTVRVLNIDSARKRIALELIQVVIGS